MKLIKLPLIKLLPAALLPTLVGLAACGAKYPIGTAVITAETTAFYYPEPEVAYTPENLAIIEKNGRAMGCKTPTGDGASVSAWCGPTVYIAGKNGYNPKVIAIGCLGKLDPAGLEACISSSMKLVAGTK